MKRPGSRGAEPVSFVMCRGSHHVLPELLLPNNLGPHLVAEHKRLLVEDGDDPDHRPVEEVLNQILGEEWAFRQVERVSLDARGK